MGRESIEKAEILRLFRKVRETLWTWVSGRHQPELVILSAIGGR